MYLYSLSDTLSCVLSWNWDTSHSSVFSLWLKPKQNTSLIALWLAGEEADMWETPCSFLLHKPTTVISASKQQQQPEALYDIIFNRISGIHTSGINWLAWLMTTKLFVTSLIEHQMRSRTKVESHVLSSRTSSHPSALTPYKHQTHISRDPGGLWSCSPSRDPPVVCETVSLS